LLLLLSDENMSTSNTSAQNMTFKALQQILKCSQ